MKGRRNPEPPYNRTKRETVAAVGTWGDEGAMTARHANTNSKASTGQKDTQNHPTTGQSGRQSRRSGRGVMRER